MPLCRMIYDYWSGDLTIPSSPTYRCIITRIRNRYFSATQNLYSNGHPLPLYANNVSCVEKEELRFHPMTPSASSLSKTFILLAFKSVLDMFQIQTTSSSPSQDQQSYNHIFIAFMVVVFAASLSGNFLTRSKPRLAVILDKTSRLSFAMGFFVMSRVFLSGSWVMWVIGWLAGGFTMLAFLMSCLI